MKVLIVESQPDLGRVWQSHLQRCGMDVDLVRGQMGAARYMSMYAPDIIILDLVLEEGSPLAIADYASFRHPDARVIFVTNTSFFSDGSIFSHACNACAFVPTQTLPDDLAAMVEHFGAPSQHAPQ